MSGNNFYKKIIEKYLDEFVSFEFEKICQYFLQYYHLNDLTEIGRYWGEKPSKISSPENSELEIDIVLKKQNELSIFECKWSKNEFDNRQLQNLKKSLYLEKILSSKINFLGFFLRTQKPNINLTNCFFYDLKDIYLIK